jgi:hypothetical protein
MSILSTILEGMSNICYILFTLDTRYVLVYLYTVEPKNGVEKYADYTVGKNLTEIIQILENIQN